MTPRTDVLIGNLTHVGMERSENQDYYGYYEPDDPREFDLKGRLIVVCDGMGGHAGGERASRLAVETILNEWKTDDSGEASGMLRKSIEIANRAVWDEAQAQPQLKGMGSTCVALCIKQGKAHVAHVGDSRCYVYRSGDLQQITKDHSLVQQMVDEGLLREEDMESHPEKNVILRSLGVKPDVDVEVNQQPVQTGDIFLLCTDGLTGLVSKEEMKRIVDLHKEEPMSACAKLVDLANKYGGYDNITVQIAKVNSLDAQPVAPKKEIPVEHRSTTSTFSQEEVQKAIAEARAKAGLPPGTTAPKGGAPAAAASGKGGAVASTKTPPASPPPAAAALEKPRQPAAAAAAAAKGRGLGVPLVLAIAILVLAGGLFGGTILAKGTSDARRDMLAAKQDAQRAGAEGKSWNDAVQKEKDAEEAWKGILGPMLAGEKFRVAKQAFETAKKFAPGGGGTTPVPDGRNVDEIYRQMTEAKKAAEQAGAIEHAATLWHTAQGHEQTGDENRTKDPGAAASHYAKAIEKYAKAAEVARLRAEAQRLRTGLLNDRDEAAKVKALVPTTVDRAEKALSEGDRAFDAETYADAKLYYYAADQLFKSAVADATEKKNGN